MYDRKTWALAVLAIAMAGCAGHETKEVTNAAVETTAAPATSCVPPPSELVVKDLKPGTGDTVRFRTAVLTSYTGWLYDGCKPDFKGAIFDETGTKPPISWMVGTGHVIRGWDEGLIGMKEGGTRLLIIPADKAYGANPPPGGKIPPNAPLVFEVHLDHIILQAGPPK